MTILQAHKYYRERDGASKYMLQLSDLLESDGHSVIPFALDEGAKTLDSDYRKYFVESLDLSDPHTATLKNKLTATARMYYSVHAKSQLSALLKAESVDLAHIHNIYHHISPSVLTALKKKGIPIVMTLHDYKLIAPNYTLFHHGKIHEENARGLYLSNIWQRSMKDSLVQSAIVTGEMIFHHKLMRYYERFVDHFISPSQFLIDVCVRHGWPREKFTHIPNMIVPERTSVHTADSDAAPYVAYLGRLSPEKGVQVLVDAAARIPDVQVRIAGHGPIEAELRAQVAAQGLRNVSFEGFLSGAALDAFTANAVATIVPSIWYENNPLAILESCLAGNVVIGSNIAGIAEMLPEPLLVPPGDDAALARTISYWMQATPEERRSMGTELAARVRAVNDPAAHLLAVQSVYNNVMNQ